jgi:tetratricopeptide (TPR) repeat protein
LGWVRDLKSKGQSDAERWESRAQAACKREDWIEAQSSFSMAKELYEKEGKERQAAEMLSSIGLCLYNTGDMEGAREALEASLEKKRAFGDVKGEAEDLVCLGDVCMRLQNVRKAIDCYLGAKSKFQDSEVPEGIAIACKRLDMAEEKGKSRKGSS